ncbi:MAG: inositol monophosphatase [Rhizobiales bacterium]|nr:inositol monophosphatase [Hyphomicrobiales bacterium]NRB14178.1 inositol monophosphatase [Hyphomicrobiales bacterium]
MARTALLNIMVNTVRKVARGLVRDFGEVENLQISYKGPQDFVTSSDLRIESKLIEELNELRPGYGILSEEAGETIGTDKTHRWIIDPIDGTLNFMHANPHFCISLALEREGKIQAGVIYNPITDELFEAEANRGAFLNDYKLKISGRKKLSDTLIATGDGGLRDDAALYYRRLARAQNRTHGVRLAGAAALDLANLAAGRTDGFYESGLKIWDVAAGVLMVQEAGGTVMDIDGSEFDYNNGRIVASNPELMPQIVEMLKI